MAIGAVTALNPDEHMTGILTALEIEYAAANVGVAYNYQSQANSLVNINEIISQLNLGLSFQFELPRRPRSYAYLSFKTLIFIPAPLQTTYLHLKHSCRAASVITLKDLQI